MRRMLVISALLAAFTVPLALAADTPGDGTLSVKRGRGLVVLKVKGTVIGRVNKGRVQIRDARPYDGNDPQLTCRARRRIGAAVWVCKGRKIGFRVDEGRFTLNIRGTGIWISAVGRGSVAVDGAGDQGLYDGLMSVDDAPYESLPDEPTFFFLGTPPAARG